jgi:hypothetical protein
MEPRSEKKLIAAVGVAIGAGLALTFTYRGIYGKGRILHAAKYDPKHCFTPVRSSRNFTRSNSENHAGDRGEHRSLSDPLARETSRSAASIASGTPLAERVPTAVAPYPEPIPALRAADLSAIPPTTIGRPVAHGSVVLSGMQRVGAVAIDAFIVLFACCLFAGISQAMHATLTMQPFHLVILACSAALIAISYAALYKWTARDTPGEIYLKRSLKPASELTTLRESCRQSLPEPAGEIGRLALFTAFTRKSAVPRSYARIYPLI